MFQKQECMSENHQLQLPIEPQEGSTIYITFI